MVILTANTIHFVSFCSAVYLFPFFSCLSPQVSPQYTIENGRVLIGDATSVYLRVRVRGLRLDFSFSLDGENYTAIATDLDGSDLSVEAYGEIGHEGHTGTFIGMACQDLSGLRAYADFEFFEYFECEEK